MYDNRLAFCKVRDEEQENHFEPLGSKLLMKSASEEGYFRRSLWVDGGEYKFETNPYKIMYQSII